MIKIGIGIILQSVPKLYLYLLVIPRAGNKLNEFRYLDKSICFEGQF